MLTVGRCLIQNTRHKTGGACHMVVVLDTPVAGALVPGTPGLDGLVCGRNGEPR